MTWERATGRWAARARRGFAVAALAVLTSGCALYAWGDDASEQLGQGPGDDGTEIPLQVGTTESWTSISAGGFHTCALDAAKALWCWGNGAGSSHTAPAQVGSSTNWESVSAGGLHTCAIDADATLWCWGSNSFGQLGDGTFDDRNTPEAVDDAAWASVNASLNATCAIRTDGSLWCWGNNTSGRLGDGTTTTKVVPVQIGSATWAQVAMPNALPGHHTCGIQTNGSLWCWGDNADGAVGDGTNTTRLVPTLVNATTWIDVAVGAEHTCGIIELGGALLCWGENRSGQLGDGTVSDRLVPTFVALAERFDWRSISAGGQHNCGVKAGNVARCWGANDFGQLGTADTTDRLVPTAPSVPTDWVELSAGRTHTVGLRLP